MRVIQRAAIACLLIAVCGCRTTNMGGAGGSFLEAARAAGVSVRADEIVTNTADGNTFSIAPVTTWEQTPATALRGGTNIAFVYLSDATETIPKGYYTLRAFADAAQTGTMPATIEFVDRGGKVAAKINATTEIHSLTIPENRSTTRVFVTVRNEPRPQANALPRSGPIRVIILCCPNGDCFLVIVS